MKQVTVNLKLDIVAAISCADLLSRQGIDTSQQPMSTTIRVGLETLTEYLRDAKQLPQYEDTDDKELIERFNQMFKEQISEMKELDFGGLKDFRPKADIAADKSRQEIAADVERHIEGQSIPAIRTSSEETETQDIATHQDIFKLDSDMTFAEIKEMAPNNEHVKDMCKNPDPVMQKAIEVIFPQFDPDYWNTAMITKMVRNLAKEHKDES